MFTAPTVNRWNRLDLSAGGLVLCFVLGVAGMVLAAFHIRDPFTFVVLWTVQHWMVAVGLATLVAKG